MTTSPCGCRTAPDPSSGVLRSVSRCPFHLAARRDPATLDAAYYEELGVLKGGKLAETAHVAELVEALGEFPVARPCEMALEIGCGVSPYVMAFAASGYHYLGIDPSPWAAQWMERAYGVRVLNQQFPEDDRMGFIAGFGPSAGLILAAHSLEHMDDAPGAIRNCAAMLNQGGELWVVVPDDSDQCNPDHEFYFTLETLRSCIEAAGLVVERFAVRRYVPHERFLYVRARKPE